MSKVDHEFTVSASPYNAFAALGAAMVQCGVKPFRQEGWVLKGQEGFGVFKMGFPATVTATVYADPAGAKIALHGENLGYGLNTVHIRRLLTRVAEATTTAVAAMPPMPAEMTEALAGGTASGTGAESPGAGFLGAEFPVADDPNLPPRIG